ncbi:glucose-6-phosphate isomerase [Flexistipes sinusarabici]|uniref:Glucose-6-phosphate isomerase n=1 Tax=Flexistipes sinusarabici TaxID=2352 RepID=A0A3D5QCJ6_FLESI|nr:glucose-6-phosphate isomerase [Flexistipes sinusarabici]HCW93575.1 glucose-6-phosphate isomerase [Flexistipes sinusarabici]
MSYIKLDYNYTMSEFLENGLTDEELEASKDAAKKGLSDFITLSEESEVGFSHLPEFDLSQIKKTVKASKGQYNDLIIVGIGGSSLGVEAVTNALLPHGYNALSFGERGCLPRVWFADNVDPHKLYWILKKCEAEDTLVCVITKSGSTVETISNFSIIYKWLNENLKDPFSHIYVITDPEKGPLREFAEMHNIKTFSIPSNVGGRFSVLSPVGIVPAALLGLDIDRMMEGAEEIVKSEKEKILHLSAIYLSFIKRGLNINVMMPYTSRLKSFCEWFSQLWSESLGKRYTKDGSEIHAGTTPVGAVGANDQHSQLQLYKEGPSDKLITFVELGSHDFDAEIQAGFHPEFSYLTGHSLGQLMNYELHATELSLRKAGKPSLKLVMDGVDECSVGKLFMLMQYVVAVTGLSMDINPFDQPGVEEGKHFAYGMLGREGFEEKKKEFDDQYIKSDEYIL